MIKREDILLALLSAPVKGKENMMSSIQIMKSLFLLKQELNLENFYEFVPYLYGPCSFEVYSDLIKLKNKDFVSEILMPFSRKFWRVTKQGETYIKKRLPEFDNNLISKIQEIKIKVLNMNFIELLSYIYKKYPEYAKNSVFNIDVLKK